MHRANLIEIPSDVISEEELNEILQSVSDTQEEEDVVLEYLNKSPKVWEFLNSSDKREGKFRIQRGDVVHIAVASNYRNDFKYIYDGFLLMGLDHDIDDYGSVPSTFSVIDEFPIGYWDDVIEHNNINYFNPTPYEDQIYANLKLVGTIYSNRNKAERKIIADVYETSFVHEDGTTYRIYAYMEEGPFPVPRQTLENHFGLGIYDSRNEFVEELNLGYDPQTTLFTSIFAEHYIRQEGEMKQE